MGRGKGDHQIRDGVDMRVQPTVVTRRTARQRLVRSNRQSPLFSQVVQVVVYRLRAFAVWLTTKHKFVGRCFDAARSADVMPGARQDLSLDPTDQSIQGGVLHGEVVCSRFPRHGHRLVVAGQEVCDAIRRSVVVVR